METNHDHPELRDLLAAVGRRAGERARSYRDVLILLRSLSEPSGTGYARLLQAGAAKDLASKFKLLLDCPSVAEQFLEGLAWDKALAAARKLRPTAWQRRPEQTKQDRAKAFASRLATLGLNEFVHPRGTFRLLHNPVGLFGATPA